MTGTPADRPQYTLVGRTPPPRVLFVSHDDVGAKLAARFAERIPTAKVVDVAGSMEVWQPGVDLAVVLDTNRPQLDDRIHVLQIGGERCGTFRSDQAIVAVGRDQLSRADAWMVPELPDDLDHLVRQDLLRLLPMGTRAGAAPESPTTPVLTFASRAPWQGGGSQPIPEGQRTALVIDPHGAHFATEVRRTSEGAFHWILPAGASPDLWLSYVLQRLHEVDPAMFPLRSGWSEAAAYQSPAEVDARTRLADVATRRAVVLADLEAEEARAKEDLLAAGQAAEDNERQLVTTQKRALVSAVQACLNDLGFTATDSDQEASASDLLEDLQVTVEGDEDVTLAEVRGYKGGAAVSDLGRIYRFNTNYAAKHGRPADRLWYIVNQFVGRVPADRPRPMTSHAADLEEFAKSNGLVIDTADLLALWMQIQRGQVEKDAARQMLLDARGVFELPE